MKKISIGTAACALLVAGGLNAQTIYDANRFMESDLNGTARYVGMGGAMGALGGDISTMNTNPAGIGLYRSNDFMLSFGFNSTGAEAKTGNETSKANSIKGSFDNIGFVYSNKIGNKTALRYVNFGFNYNKKKNFNKNMLMAGDLGYSQTSEVVNMAMNGVGGFAYLPEELGAKNAFVTNDPYTGWLPALFYQGYLINEVMEDGKFVGYEDYQPNRAVYNTFRSEERGGINEYDFNLSFNISDMVYIGGTLGAYNVDYTRYTAYGESFTDAGYYDLENWSSTSGAGIDFKLGVIFRPASSPLRIGLAVHTPTLYVLRDRNSVRLSYQDLIKPDGTLTGFGDLRPTDAEGMRFTDGDAVTDYRLVTPWKLNFSLGYTIGKFLALGAEYEFKDNTTARLQYDDDYGVSNMEWENGMIKDMLKATHTFKIGAEAKLTPTFSVRGGYNHITGAFEKGAIKDLASNGVRTDTEYDNTKAINNYTLGMGYRGRMFYADLAYQYSRYKSDFYPFYHENLAATKVNNDRHQLLMTLGVRF